MNLNFDEIRNNSKFNTLFNDIGNSLLKFNNKIIQDSISGVISGVYVENDNLHNPEGTSINFNCNYKLEGSDDNNIIDMYMWYKEGKLHKEGGSVRFLDMEKIQMYVIY